MCVVSMVGDHFNDRWKPFEFPKFPNPGPVDPGALPGSQTIIIVPKEEFDALKREVEHMKELLKKAKIYDEQTGQKECEQEEKIALLRKMAEHFGISLDEIFGKAKT